MLSRRGFEVEAYTDACDLPFQSCAALDGGSLQASEPFERLRDAIEAHASTIWPSVPSQMRLLHKGVAVTLDQGMASRSVHGDPSAQSEVLGRVEQEFDRFRPDVLVNHGGDWLSRQIRDSARRRGIAVVFTLHNLGYRDPRTFIACDLVIVPSRYSAERYRERLGLDFQVLPNVVDFSTVKVHDVDPRFVTFVNPSHEKGVYFFARLADELGRRQPDIPLLVVEARGTEETLASCGLDLRARGNLFLMANTPDPARFWGVTRFCLAPSLCEESQCLVAVEAMVNGIPVLASDRGALPETLGRSGLVLTIPGWMTADGRVLPTTGEVSAWVEAVVRLWDDHDLYQEHRRLAADEARRWHPEVLEPRFVDLFNSVRP